MNLDRTLDDEQMAMTDAAVKRKKSILAIWQMECSWLMFILGNIDPGFGEWESARNIFRMKQAGMMMSAFVNHLAIIFTAIPIANSGHHQAKKPKRFMIGQVCFGKA